MPVLKYLLLLHYITAYVPIFYLKWKKEVYTKSNYLFSGFSFRFRDKTVRVEYHYFVSPFPIIDFNTVTNGMENQEF